MDNSEVQERIKTVKTKIEKLIEDGHIDEAKSALDNYNGKMPGDPDICSMRAVVAIMEGSLEEAETCINEGLRKDSVQFDLLYNLAYLRELQGLNEEAADLYRKTETVADTDERKQNINLALEKLKAADTEVLIKDKVKIVFFVKEGMDSFLGEIINGLSDEYWVRKIIVSDFKQINEGMRWADICWFEWCDELIIYGSKLNIPANKKIVCRIHGYEVYSDMIQKVDWENVDELIIVAPHIRRIFEEKLLNTYNGHIKISTIFCGVDTEKYPVSIKTKGYHLGYIGFINYKKNIPLTLDIFKKLYDKDKKYKLFIAGKCQDDRILSYIEYFIKENKLEGSVIFDGWQNYEQKVQWLKKIDYMVISSIDEGLCYAAAEAMCSGIKPVLHNCEGIRDHYSKKYIFNSVDEAVEIIVNDEYNSLEYREFIEKKYSNKIQINSVREVLERIFPKDNLSKNTISNVSKTTITLQDPENRTVKLNSITLQNDHSKKIDLLSNNFDNTVEDFKRRAEVCNKWNNTFEAALYYAHIFKSGCSDIIESIEDDIELYKAFNFIMSNNKNTFIFVLSEGNSKVNILSILKLSSEFSQNIFLVNPAILESAADSGTDVKGQTLGECLNSGRSIDGTVIYSPVCILNNSHLLYENVSELILHLVKEYSDMTSIKLIFEDGLQDIIESRVANKFKTVYQAVETDLLSYSYYYDIEKECRDLYNVNIFEALSRTSRLFSIVIPTRNSAEYLKYTLLSCIDQNFEDYEILVSDNSTPGNNETFDLVKSINSEKIRYIRPPKELSLVKSFEYAYLKSEGEYLFSLGSDDALLLHSLNYLYKIVNQYPEEDIIQWGKTFYRWPGYPENPDMFYIPVLPKNNDISCNYYSSNDLVQQIMDYQTDMFVLPMIYLNSAMHRRRIKKIIDATGRFLDGEAQDIYTGFINLALSERVLYTNIPFIIAASSVNSIGYNGHFKDIYLDESDIVKITNKLGAQYLDSYITKYCAYMHPNNDSLRVKEFIKVSEKKINTWDYKMVNWKKFYEGYATSISADDLNFRDKLINIQKAIGTHNNKELGEWFLDNFINNENFTGLAYRKKGNKNYPKGLLPNGNQLILDMSEFGIRNVYDVAKFFRNLFNI